MMLEIKKGKRLPKRRLQRKGIKYEITDLSRINPATYEMLIEIIDLIRDGRVEETDDVEFELAQQAREDDVIKIAGQLSSITICRTEEKYDFSCGCFISTGCELRNRTVTIYLVKESIKPIKEYFEQTRISTIEALTDLMIYVADKRAETMCAALERYLEENADV